MDNLEKKDINERKMKEIPEDFYARVEEAAREGAKQGARSGGGGGSFLLNLLRVLIMLIPAFIVVILFLRIQSFTGEVKDIFKKDAAVEERDLTLENHGILGYTAADFQEAILGDSKQLKKLEIAPEVVDPEDVEMLSDLIMAAVNEAMTQCEETTAREMQKITGGMQGLPF